MNTEADAANPSSAQSPDALDRARLYPRATSFRFRRGSLTTGQRRNWDALWPTLGRDLLIGPDRVDEPPLDPRAWFGRDAPLILEVGSGTGIATAAMAEAEPDKDVIAIEVYQPGLAQLLGLVHRGGLTNVRMIRGDATVVLDELVAPGSLTGVRVFFPDPWPKARHHKRRFLQPGTVELIADRLRPGGVLHVATDHADYADWVAEVLANQDPGAPHLVPLEGESPILLERPTTKFEGRAHREGRDITEFVWCKPSDPQEAQ